MADGTNNIMFSNNTRLFPSENTGQELVQPNEQNFRKLTESSLQMRQYTDEYGGGRLGGVWWFIWIIILASIIMFWPGESVEEELFIGVIAMIFSTSFIIPFLIIWRRELPVCFNRNTRTVSYWVKGELAQVNWDEIEAYAQTKRSVTAGSGTLLKEQVIAFNVFTQGSGHYEPEEHNLTISAADSSGGEDPVAEAKGLWEYIRLYMNEGKGAMPETKITGAICSLKESIKENNPLPRPGDSVSEFIFNTIFLPLSLPFAFINIITDMVYCVLDKILPKRRLPKPLREACEAE